MTKNRTETWTAKERRDTEWWSDKGHVWLITLIFKLMYKRFVTSLLCFALKRCVTRYFQQKHRKQAIYSLIDLHERKFHKSACVVRHVSCELEFCKVERKWTASSNEKCGTKMLLSLIKFLQLERLSCGIIALSSVAKTKPNQPNRN